MPIELAAFTSDELAVWMQAELGADTAALLGWSALDDYTRIVAGSVRAAGLSSVDTATDETALLTYARQALWNAARRALVSAVNLGFADGDRIDREALYKHAVAEAERADAAVSMLVRATVPAMLRQVRVRRPDPFHDQQRRWWPR